jgi:hypothetical protein
LKIEVTCSDPSVAFAGEWPRPEAAAEIVARYRERARALGVPIQIAIERQGVWSIAPNGKAIHGPLFDLEKLVRKEKRSAPRRFGRSTVQGKKPKTRP